VGIELIEDKHGDGRLAKVGRLRGIEDCGQAGGGGQWQCVRGRRLKGADRLRHTIFKDAEVVFGEIGDRLAVFVADDDIKNNQTRVDGEGRGVRLIVLSVQRSEARRGKEQQKEDADGADLGGQVSS
jgi:hypothetical protein